MARLPVPGQDQGTWGQILNEFLLVAHHEDGTSKLAETVASKYAKPADGIPESDLDATVQAKLNALGGQINWGDIAGTLSSQTDLQNALNQKADTAHDHDGSYAASSHGHSIANVTNLQSSLDDKADSSHSHTLNSLSDVTAPSPSNNQVLTWNGSAWAPATPQTGVTAHGDLTGLSSDDHTIYALADGSRGDFAATGHNHNADYAAVSHDHDDAYALTGHDHNSDYEPSGAVASHASVTTDVHGINDFANVPRVLLYNDGWPARPDDDRPTEFRGGDLATDAPTDANLRSFDTWVPIEDTSE